MWFHSVNRKLHRLGSLYADHRCEGELKAFTRKMLIIHCETMSIISTHLNKCTNLKPQQTYMPCTFLVPFISCTIHTHTHLNKHYIIHTHTYTHTPKQTNQHLYNHISATFCFVSAKDMYIRATQHNQSFEDERRSDCAKGVGLAPWKVFFLSQIFQEHLKGLHYSTNGMSKHIHATQTKK